MSRAVRIEYPGASYHVMARGVARMPTFLDEDDRRAFLGVIEPLVQLGVLEIHAFCLMANHYHLLLRTPHGDLARWMRHINGDYAQKFNYRHGRVGHVWQGRYKAILIEEAGYLKVCSRYIHLNPTRARSARPADRYRWSSYRNYLGKSAAAPWVTTHAVLAEFDGDRKAYRDYVEAGEGDKQFDPFKRAVGGLLLGGERFVARAMKWLKDRRDTGEQPALRVLARTAMANPESVEKAVADIFPDVGRRRRGRLLLYAQRRHSRLRPIEIARRYGRRHSAVSMAVRTIEVESKADSALAKKLAALGKVLGALYSDK